ncbi:restriction endonuclease subunit S [Lactiplantibacillus plantarum]|uniref:restriction endonuclease subunit S n=2 Tax=Lactiplantibacillus plantarum TaxID=1590 RepID=UPI001E42C94A|nr:restriction endonuclease subunit S [Lactiplantibacillus plantarum]MCC6116296.1 restriction endonuclease subunit S [Lactiplantibacillus plantarum]MCW6113844.1 restriction endonuclease subunit S [Lactiplantibacillus plantarum]MCW6127362.1 restriction endonuclease subunit S [Lactiplantibacillus plantarum]
MPPVMFSVVTKYHKGRHSLFLYNSEIFYAFTQDILRSHTFVKVRPGSVFSECNDVIVPASGETAEDIARASHVCISGAVLGGDLNIIKPKINIIDSSFLALCISNGQQNKELIKRAQGKSIVHLHNSDLKQVVLKYPSKRNQSMIARIFDKTDNLIAANEQVPKLVIKIVKNFLANSLHLN